METKEERFLQYVDSKGITDKAFELKCGLSNGVVNNVRAGRSKIGDNSIQKAIAAYPDLDYNWLMYGASADTPPNSATAETIIRRLDTTRIKLDISYQQIADTTGVTRQAVRGYFVGRNKMHLEFFMKVCEILKILPATMFDSAKEPEKPTEVLGEPTPEYVAAIKERERQECDCFYKELFLIADKEREIYKRKYFEKSNI